jgi:hypothetical protein
MISKRVYPDSFRRRERRGEVEESMGKRMNEETSLMGMSEFNDEWRIKVFPLSLLRSAPGQVSPDLRGT